MSQLEGGVRLSEDQLEWIDKGGFSSRTPEAFESSELGLQIGDSIIDDFGGELTRTDVGSVLSQVSAYELGKNNDLERDRHYAVIHAQRFALNVLRNAAGARELQGVEILLSVEIGILDGSGEPLK